MASWASRCVARSCPLDRPAVRALSAACPVRSSSRDAGTSSRTWCGMPNTRSELAACSGAPCSSWAKMPPPESLSTTSWSGSLLHVWHYAQLRTHALHFSRALSITTVNGERVPMRPCDLLLTPSWHWHDHTHFGDGADVARRAKLPTGQRPRCGFLRTSRTTNPAGYPTRGPVVAATAARVTQPSVAG